MKKLILFLLASLFLGAMFYFQLPVLAFGFKDVGILFLIILILCLFLFTKTNITSNKVKMVSKPHKLWFYGLGLVLIYIFVLPFLLSSPIFHADSYQKLIGKVKNGTEISNHIAPISMDEVRVVDEDLAYLLGDKVLGSQPALGSQVELGEFFIQKINNKLYWVAPLMHSGFFKWMNNTQGTPGYVMVSATNERDVKLVQTVNNKPVQIKLQENAYFGDNLHRHLYFNGFATVGLTDFSFELDDQGNPFWVVTTFDKQVGFGGKNATGVVVVHPATGETQWYDIKNAPKWIDRIQPIDFVSEQIDDWGEFIHGYWNFSNSDKLTSTNGVALVYGHDNQSYWYTGITSVGKDESAVGFVLINTRTKETTFYRQSGATEYAAQSSAEGKVQEKGYAASFPIPYNINGIPTYIMTLKDQSGLVKMFAMVGINDYTVVGVGNTLRETLMAYKSSFNMADGKVKTGNQKNRKELIAPIIRIENDVKNGNSYYYFMLKDQKPIFVGTSQVSNSLPLAKEGDVVKIQFDADTQELIDVIQFEIQQMK